MEISEAIYGACSVSFLALIALMLLRGRSSWVGAMLLGAGAVNAVWAADLAIPGLGSYTARVLLYRDQYAGTWSGKKGGGQMFGKIVRGR